MKQKLPDLSRFELQCLRKLWNRKEATVREIQADLEGGPGYSTVRKIFERLEAKGAVERVRLEGKAWVYRPAVSVSEIVRKEIRRFLDGLFDGGAPELVSRLADMNELTVDDLREAERTLGEKRGAGDATPKRGRTKKL
jgi:BlaI family transcriptional regulator, penicillinase repressor